MVRNVRASLSGLFSLVVFLSVGSTSLAQPSPDSAKALKEFKAAVDAGDSKTAIAVLQLRGKELKGVECQAWEMAIEKAKPGTCSSELFLTMMKAGYKCGSPAKLFNAVCTEAAKAALMEMKNEEVLELAYEPILTGREKVIILQAALGLGRHLTGHLKGMCDSETDKQGSVACQKLAAHKERIQHILCKVLEHGSADSARALQQAEPGLFSEYHCAMTERIVLVRITAPSECKKGEAFLLKLGQNRALTCPMAKALERLLTHHCMDGLAMLVPKVSPADLAEATMTFNKAGTFQKGNVSPSLLQVVQDEAAFLTQANQPACDSGGPESPNCAAIQWVAQQVAAVQAAKAKQESPEAMLKDACETLVSIAFEKRIIKENEGSKDEAKQYSLKTAQQALKTWETRLETLKRRYLEATGKEMSLGGCKK